MLGALRPGRVWLMGAGLQPSVAAAVCFIAPAGVAAETAVMLIYLTTPGGREDVECLVAGTVPTATDLSLP